VTGVDDICAALRQGAAITCAHAKICRAERVKFRDRIALREIERALQIPKLRAGDQLTLGKSEIRHLRQLFSHGAIRHACTSCQWHGFCSQVAAGAFSGAKLFPQVPS
jgi:hypothetical protein